MNIDTKRIDETISKISICLKAAITALEGGGWSDHRGFGVFNRPDFWKSNTFTYNDYSFAQTFIKSGALIDYGETCPPMELWEEIEKNQQWLSHFEISNIIDENSINITEKQERLYLQKLKSNEEFLQKILDESELDFNFYVHSNHYKGNGDLSNDENLNYYRFVFVLMASFEFAYKLHKIIKEKINNFSRLSANTFTPASDEKEIKKRMKTDKLKFNNKKGNKIALYYVLRQLYEKQIIESSWSEIAAFLIENVTGFESMEVNKLAVELSRKTDPMVHRKIDIPTNLTELDE